MPGQPAGDDGPVFAAPWEAQAFAMAVTLHERGLFTWAEWADTLAKVIGGTHVGEDPDIGQTYYEQWLGALETLVAAKGATTTAELADYRAAWGNAAERTPHGQPIELRTADFELRTADFEPAEDSAPAEDSGPRKNSGRGAE